MTDTGAGNETIVAELLAFLSEKIEMKYVQGILVWQL